MRTHRPHKKSRNGCKTCKSRKIKCDELRPTCTNCAYRGSTCTYPDFIQFVPVQVKTPDLVSAAFEHELDRVDRSSHLWDMMSRLPRSPVPFKGPIITNSDLVAHYCRFTSKTFAVLQNSDARSEVWLRGIPLVALQHESVSHAVSALAAMNLWWLATMEEQQRPSYAYQELYLLGDADPQPKSPRYAAHVYLDQAQVHYGRCLQLFQNDLKCLKAENSDAVLACAAMLGVCGLVHSQMERNTARRSVSPRSSPSSSSSRPPTPQYPSTGPREGTMVDLRWIQLFRGVKSVREQMLLGEANMMSGSPIMPLVEPSQNDYATHSPRYALSPTTPSYTIPNRAVHATILEEGPAALSHLRNLLESRLAVLHSVSSFGSRPSWNINSLEICLRALQVLQSITTKFDGTIHPSHRMLMVWVASGDPAYHDLLAQQDEVALAVYAHYLVYTMLLDDLWWVSDLGTTALTDILDAVGYNDGYGMDLKSVSQTLFSWPAKIARLYDEDGG